MSFKSRIGIIGILFFFLLSSCSKKEEKRGLLDPASERIEMEAEGGETELFFQEDHWNIEKIINQNGEVAVVGDMYSKNGESIGKNKVLTLDGTGRLTADWKDKGFTIIRDEPSSLKIRLKENSTGEKFNFVLVLHSDLGENPTKIYVSQKESQGYTFHSIDYHLETGDGDSLYVKKGTVFTNNLLQPKTITFSPLTSGIDMQRKSHFESRAQGAFTWLAKDPVEVEVPTDIRDGELFFNGETQVYTDEWRINPNPMEKTAEVALPEGESSFYTEVTFRKRTVSFILTLTNRRTGEKKTLPGKWIETAPTGEYSIVLED